ncbi:MAG: dihydrolipoyl dehydrogenase [Thermoleophilia bacterium]
MSGDAGEAVDVLVLGGGPGGYTAAFRAADLGLSTVLVEREPQLGGVCLNVGCIPSKALLHVAKLITDAEHSAEVGVAFTRPEVDIDRVRSSTRAVVGQLNQGLAGLARKRKVRVLTGQGMFTGPNSLEVTGPDGAQTVEFRHAIVAVGSEPVRIPGLPDDPRVIDSTGALALQDVPQRLLVIGGGIIGLEMACVYDALGSRVTVVEMLPQLMTGCDPDIVKPLQDRITKRYEAIHLSTKVTGVTARKDGLRATLEGPDGTSTVTADRILVAVGRRAIGDRIGLDRAGVSVDERGIIAVDEQMRTNVAHIHAIGDVVGNPMLAHKATHQGVVAAEVIAGQPAAFDPRTIPSVAYTDPEVAWAGLTELQAKERGIPHEVSAFPWAASGRALTVGRSEGRTKLIVEPGTHRILGAGIVGVGAGDLISPIVFALEMGSVAEDLALTIHPHPSFSETLGMVAEAAEGTITDLYLPKKR